MNVPAINTIVVEDHEIARFGLIRMLSQVPEVNVIAEVLDGRDAIDKAISLKPDLILMDIDIPVVDGIEATKQIKNAVDTKVIIITSHDTPEEIFSALSAQADAYCLKGVSAAQLATAIRSVMNDAMWLDPNIAKQVVGALQNKRPVAGKGSAPLSTENTFRLSDREMQVLELVVEGLSNQQIGERLSLSIETVKTHMKHLLEKLGVPDRTSAAVKAVQQGIIGSSGESARDQ